MGVTVTQEDIYLWLENNRYDIIERLRPLPSGGEIEIPISGPDTVCIFLKKENGSEKCSIYDVRPVTCRLYPISGNVKPIIIEGCSIPFKEIKRVQEILVKE